jgi:hypothetical protein
MAWSDNGGSDLGANGADNGMTVYRKSMRLQVKESDK